MKILYQYQKQNTFFTQKNFLFLADIDKICTNEVLSPNEIPPSLDDRLEELYAKNEVCQSEIEALDQHLADLDTQISNTQIDSFQEEDYSSVRTEHIYYRNGERGSEILYTTAAIPLSEEEWNDPKKVKEVLEFSKKCIKDYRRYLRFAKKGSAMFAFADRKLENMGHYPEILERRLTELRNKPPEKTKKYDKSQLPDKDLDQHLADLDTQISNTQIDSFQEEDYSSVRTEHIYYRNEERGSEILYTTAAIPLSEEEWNDPKKVKEVLEFSKKCIKDYHRDLKFAKKGSAMFAFADRKLENMGHYPEILERRLTELRNKPPEKTKKYDKSQLSYKALNLANKYDISYKDFKSLNKLNTKGVRQDISSLAKTKSRKILVKNVLNGTLTWNDAETFINNNIAVLEGLRTKILAILDNCPAVKNGVRKLVNKVLSKHIETRRAKDFIDKSSGLKVSELFTALRNKISRGEGGYNSFNRGIPGVEGKPLSTPISKMTISEIMKLQSLNKDDPNRLFAVGRYQFIPATLKEAVNHVGINKEIPFSEDVQNMLFEYLISSSKRPKLAAYLNGKSNDLEAAMMDLSKEFASIPNLSGNGYYDNDSAGNHALGGLGRAKQIADILKFIRQKKISGSADVIAQKQKAPISAPQGNTDLV